MQWWEIILIVFGVLMFITIALCVYCSLVLASREDEQMEKYYRHVSDAGKAKEDDGNNGSGAYRVTAVSYTQK